MDAEIIWTVLPNGRINGKARATLFIAPQLSGGSSLGEFELFQNWPRALINDSGKWNIDISLRCSNSNVQIESIPVAEKESKGNVKLPDPFLWVSVFPAGTPVKSFEVEDLSQRRIHSFPKTNIKTLIDKSYRTFATTSPTKLPRKTRFLEGDELPVNDISVIPRTKVSIDGKSTVFTSQHQRRDYAEMAKDESKRQGKTFTRDDLRMSELRRQIDTEVDKLFIDPKLGKLKAIPPGPPNARNDFAQLKKFTIPRRTRPLEDKVKAAQMDFHQIVTAYSQYPALMRQLGLAIDIILLSDPPAGNGVIWVNVSPGNLQTKAPRTHYSFDGGKPDYLCFVVQAEKDSEHHNRCLQLGKSEYSLEHLDVASAGSKVMDLAEKLMQETTSRSSDTDERAALPSLQTAGISLVRTGRAEMYHKYFSNQQVKLRPYLSRKSTISTSSSQASIRDKSKLKTTHKIADEQPAAELWADDLIRGYRIDVFDGTSGQWRSLCSRKTIFEIADGSQKWEESAELNDGWISLAVTESRDEDDNDLYMQESLFRWSGWSLVAPRPGKTLSTDYKSVEQVSEPAQSLNLHMNCGALKGSLPRLRFGTSYKIRARAVDIAGNSLSLDEANELTAGDKSKQLVIGDNYTYRRYEPVAQPVVLAYNPLDKSNGESIERLVIRSYNSDPSKDKIKTNERTQRHIAPTGAAQLLAETYGKFDDKDGRPRPEVYKAIINHDNPLPNKDSVYKQPSVPLTYLPDPAAMGAAFADLPTDGTLDKKVIVQSGEGRSETWNIEPPSRTINHVHQISFGQESLWPDLKTFRLIVSGTLQPENPRWDSAKREFHVFLVPGETRKVRLSSFISEKDLEKFQIWNSIEEEGKAKELRSRVLAGVHWMITPYRELTLVHAVQQPLLIPEFDSLTSHRKKDESWTTLADAFPVDGRSTSQIDVHGSWREINDSGVRPRRMKAKAHAFKISLNYEDSEVMFGPDKSRSFIQVNPRRMGLMDSTTSQTFSQTRVGGNKDVSMSLMDLKTAQVRKGQPASQTHAAESRFISREKSQTQASPVPGIRPSDLSVDAGILQRHTKERPIGRHNFGDTKYRRVTYTASATTRYLEYLSFFQEYKAFQKNHFDRLSRGERKGDISTLWSQENPEKGFTRQSEPVTTDVLSSARPPVPEIEYIIPTFGWERNRDSRTTSSKRIGGGLRVYLKRPWFISGEGELLGVVIGQAPKERRSVEQRIRFSLDRQKSYITQWGMDPIWRSAPTPQSWTPGFKNFRNASQTETNLTLDELPGFEVSVVGYVVGEWDQNDNLIGFDEDRQLWYCDIEIDPGESYFPFIRLALARYQPNSISWNGQEPGDVKLSRIVLADFAQLAPDRFASITIQSANTLKVVITGTTYIESGADVYGPPELTAQRQAVSSTDRTPKLGQRQQGTPTVSKRVFQNKAATVPQGGGRVEVNLEVSVAGHGDVLGWVEVPETTVELKRDGRTNSWIGDLTLPESRESQNYRLVIREYEFFLADSEEHDGEKSMVRPKIIKRLVYADVLEI